MDLVGDDTSAVASYDVADALELAPGEDPAQRVVRLGEQQGACAIGEQPVEGGEVDPGALGIRIDDQVDPLPPGDLSDRELRWIAGHRHHDRAGLGEHVEGEPDPGGDVGRRDHVRRVDLVAELPEREAGVRLSQRAALLEVGVAGESPGDRVGQRGGNRRRPGVVALGDPRREHALVHQAPLAGQRVTELLVGAVHDHGPSL